MYCRHCGTKLPDDARFCAACGLRTVPGPQDQASTAPRIQYSDYWKAIRQFGLGMKWYVCQTALYALFVPISIHNFGVAIDNLGGVHDAYYILLAVLSIAMAAFYLAGILANLRFKKTFVIYVYAELVLGILASLSMLIMMPVGGGMVIALIITLCIYIGLMIANYFYYKKRMSLLLD